MMSTVIIALLLMLCAFGLAQVLGRAAEYRLVRHLGGKARVPLTLERIVSLHVSFNEALAALGVVPELAGDSFPLVADRRGIGATLERHSLPLWQHLPTVQRRQAYEVRR